MKYSEDIKLEIGGKFINGNYHKNLKQLTRDLDRLIKSFKSEQLIIQRVSQQSELLLDYTKQLKKQGSLTSGQDESKLVKKYLSNNCG